MAAFGAHFHLIPVGAHRFVDISGVGSVQGNQRRYPAFVILHQLAAAFEVAQPLLTGIEHKHKALGGVKILFQDIFDDGKQHRHIGGIVPDAGAMKLTILLFHRHRFHIGENGVGMGHKHHDIVPSIALEGIDHVQSRIDIDPLCAQSVQPVFNPLGPEFFMVGGSGDLAECFEQ